jgi:8-oxo-dGTP pyrophosphatase MutT (NUDIX family)
LGLEVTLIKDGKLEQIERLLNSRQAKSLQGLKLKLSAVFVLLYRTYFGYVVLLNKRTQKVKFNKGEICFPGGGMDKSDDSLLATALRETHEEMGIRSVDVDLLGELDETTTRTGFVIKPFLGTIPYPYEFNPNDDEVEEVLEVPVATLLDPNNVSEVDWAHSRLYSYKHHQIYGATARILEQMIRVMEESGWDGA